MSGLSTEGEELLRAVKELTQTVEGLSRAMEAVPSRAEIQLHYETRRETKARRRTVVMGMVGAIVLSSGFTVQVGSYCFLQGKPRAGENTVCRMFPSYDRFLDNYTDRQKLLGDLKEATEENKKDIDELKKKVYKTP